MAAAHARGWRGAVPHFRGCGGEPNRLARAYHSGDSAEADWLLRRFRSAAHAAPLFAIGVSLGGNVLLKWLGEQGEAAREILAAAAAVSAPVDLTAAGEALGRGFNLVYARHFLATLKRKTAAKIARFPGLADPAAVARSRTLREFDDLVTAPLHGFRDASDYWLRSSSKPLLGRICVPTLVVHARNDPFHPEAHLPGPDEVSTAVELDFPETGGHVGFVSGRFPGTLAWLPDRLLVFFDEVMRPGAAKTASEPPAGSASYSPPP
jgi:predicted alpha/beta-fold hydrolase